MELNIPFIGQATLGLGFVLALGGYIFGALNQRKTADSNVGGELVICGAIVALVAFVIDYIMAEAQGEWIIGYALFGFVLDLGLFALFLGIGLLFCHCPNPDGN